MSQTSQSLPSEYRGEVLRGNVDEPALLREPVWRAIQSPFFVALLVFATFTLYAYWWLGRTWWQIKQEDGDAGKRPFWHALAMLVPVYGYFRFHAHMRAIASIARTPEARAALSPGATTVAWIIINILVGAASAPLPLWLTILASGLGAALIGYAQNALNMAWLSLPGGTRPARGHPLHWLLLVLGAILYVSVIVASVSPESA
ncbi:MAG: hypothetical protein JOZ81_14825 [Chloroflexi bacterium]|nr:hypothetical protein [Chloroflexota bacterium]